MISLLAPAKINLSLEVLGRRPDGYHEVRTVLQAVDLADEVEVQEAGRTTLRVEPPGIVAIEGNLVLLAAEFLRDAAGVSHGATITLRKRVPVAAGLGGGSSDAAAALLALRRLWELDVDDDALAVLAARLGSDVPFFLRGGTALASGRGERLEALPAPMERFAVIVTPVESRHDRKTERLYGLLGAQHYSDGSRTAEIVRRVRAGEPVGDALYNTFAAVASSAFDSFELACRLLGTTLAEHTLLAGSGPSLFALTDDEQMAEAVRERMAGDGYGAWLTRLLSV